MASSLSLRRALIAPALRRVRCRTNLHPPTFTVAATRLSVVTLRRLYSSLSELHAQQTGFAPVHRVPVFELVYPLSTINSSLSERTLRASRSTNWLRTSASGSGIWTGSHYLLSYHGTSRAVRSTNWLRTSASVRVFGPYADQPSYHRRRHRRRFRALRSTNWPAHTCIRSSASVRVFGPYADQPPPPPPILHRSRRRRRRHQHRCLHHHHCRRSRASHSTNWAALPSFMRADAPTARFFSCSRTGPVSRSALSPRASSTHWCASRALCSAISWLSPGVQPGCRSATGNKLVSWAACRGLTSIPRVVRRVPVRARTRVHVCTHTPCFVLRGDAKREEARASVSRGAPMARDVYLSLYVAREFSR